jgi:hypothetical protein
MKENAMKKDIAKKPLPSKKPSASSATADEGDLLPHYDFDYSKGKPNPFAASCPPGGRLIVLEADVAQVFTDAKTVNAVLRALIDTMPRQNG